METLVRDVGYAARLLRRSPVFSIVSILTLSLGIGATTAAFSVVNALFVRPLPGVRHGGELVTVHRVGEDGSGFHAFSYPDFLDYREGPSGLRALSVYSMFPASLSTGGEPETIVALYVSSAYFDLLGVRPAAGRFLRPEDETPGAAPTVVLSHDTWRTRFAADPAIVGRTVTLNRHPFTVVGVAEPGFHGHVAMLSFGVFVPIGAAELFGTETLSQRNASWLELIGRREPGVSIDGVRERLGTVDARLLQAWPELHGAGGIDVRTYGSVVPMARGAVLGFMGLLTLTSALVLSIAGVNVAGLSLTRALARSREVAVRLAIGAGRGRVVRQFLTESLVLFGCAAAGGTLLAWWLTGALNRAPLPIPIPLAYDFTPDVRVLGVTLLLAVAAGIVFGLAPALRATRGDLARALHGGDLGGGRTTGRNRLGRLFVVAQVAGSVVLLLASASFVRGLARAGAVTLGFDPKPVHTMTVDLTIHGYEEEAGQRLFAALERAAAETPGVESAALVSMLPLNMSNAQTVFTIPGREPAPGIGWFQTDWRTVTPGYFATMGLPIVLGREFVPGDAGPGDPVLIVSESVARLVWGDDDPVGQTLGVGSLRGPTSMRVVGVARDAKYRSYSDDGLLMIYVPLAQSYDATMTLVVRAPGAPPGLLPRLRELLRGLDPDLPVRETGRLADIIGVALLPNRIAAALAGAFGCLGLVLASIGLYGILSFLVGRRTREIGVRMALGASPRDVGWLVWSDALRLTGIGLLVGAPVATGLSLLASGMLFGIRPLDPVALAAVAGLFATVALLAALRPARRAVRLQPTDALRCD